MSRLSADWMSSAVILAAFCLSGCRPVADGSNLSLRLQDDDPSVRIAAIVQAGQQRDASTVPLLVDRLADSDADVRMFAIVSLEKITSQTLDYRYYAPLAQRQRAIEQWRAWLKNRQKADRQAHGG